MTRSMVHVLPLRLVVLTTLLAAMGCMISLLGAPKEVAVFRATRMR